MFISLITLSMLSKGTLYEIPLPNYPEHLCRSTSSMRHSSGDLMPPRVVTLGAIPPGSTSRWTTSSSPLARRSDIPHLGQVQKYWTRPLRRNFACISERISARSCFRNSSSLSLFCSAASSCCSCSTAVAMCHWLPSK